MSATRPRACCGHCRHFDNAPKTLETMIPGLRAMGSGYSSVRVNDGLCTHHDRYLSADYVCDSFLGGDTEPY